jgi:hypothetical protein|tara:strand:+ start:54 stop:623 length:570 start_codon:yes stop_codon:yes gene_type:complete
MKRNKQFETPINLAIEENARSFLSAYYKGFQFMPLAEGAWTVDWCVYNDGHLKGFCEFRRRFVDRLQYPDLRFSGAKWAKLVDLQKTYKVPSVFYVQYNDALCVIKDLDNGLPNRFVPFGRKQLRDSMDADPSVIIPREKIKVVYNRCVSDPLTQRPSGRQCDGDVENIRCFGADFIRKMEQQSRVRHA